jgi:4-hydroxy-3-polyprenylbenzoate decarboxylase
MKRKIVVGVSGASGAPYAWRILSYLAEHAETLGVEPHIVFSKTGRLVWNDEVGVDVSSFGFPVYRPGDMTAPFASGSAGFDAMLLVPCSAGHLARIATGVSTDLLSRAADVMLKERRRLVLVLRESPYNLVHLRNMVSVTEAGAIVMPASPSFYSAPEDLWAFVDTVTARALDLVNIDNKLMTRWDGTLQGARVGAADEESS